MLEVTRKKPLSAKATAVIYLDPKVEEKLQESPSIVLGHGEKGRPATYKMAGSGDNSPLSNSQGYIAGSDDGCVCNPGDYIVTEEDRPTRAYSPKVFNELFTVTGEVKPPPPSVKPPVATVGATTARAAVTPPPVVKP